jgi:hypothetical protein
MLAAGVAAFLLKNASAQVVYNESWENSLDGWGTVAGGNMTFGGFSTTTGVTEGSYSLVLDSASGSGPNYGNQFASAASTALTLDLANASSVTLDVYVPGGDFGYYLQWDLALNQQGGLGYQSVDGYNYQASAIGSESVLTWTIPTSMQATLAANPTLATSVNLQIGGGFTSTSDAVYLDDFTITDVPEPSTMALCGLGMAGLVALRRRVAKQ